MADIQEDYIAQSIELLNNEESSDLSTVIANQDNNELALLLESMPIDQRLDLWNVIKLERQLAVLLVMRSDPRETLLDQFEVEDLDILFKDIEASDLIELADSLPPRLLDRAVNALDEQQRNFFDEALAFDDDQAGHWVNQQLVVLPSNAKVRDGLRTMRRESSHHIECIFLTNRAGHFVEAVKVNKLFGAPDHLPLFDISEEEFPVILGTDSAIDAAQKVINSNMHSLPVVSETSKLLGQFDSKVAFEIVSENFESQLMAQAGLDEDEDLFAPVIKSSKSRAIWLCINLITAFAASAFIGIFEATIQQVVALAVLMPIVASMGGIAGSQTLTLMIRGLALGQVTKGNRMILFKKELSVGALNGVIWATVIGLAAGFWFNSYELGIVISLAILLNIIAAAISGVIIPIVLDKLKLDPALSGSVILTTVTDIVGFVCFLGLGTIILL
ncbi:magnesium transporter [Marinicellulosiphila megalodicopiae]|uniref:magnesium transporter n=1 Tax=Marinicellulosiphila megalodicopiae TaxID=2724896 RepID=UPI003BAFAC1D